MSMNISEERKAQLEEWDAVRKGLEEAIILLETSPDDDNIALCADFEAQLEDCVQKLNNSERDLGIVMTPNARFIRKPDGSMSCLLGDAAPLQVFFDGKKWYSCIAVNTIEPKEKLDRIQYRVWILGYNLEEVVTAESLRRWQLDLPEPVLSGQRCYAIHPTSGSFMDASIDKITPKNTVVVRFKVEAAPEEALMTSSSAPAEPPAPVFEEKEVPITHILNGKWYPQLRRVEKLSAVEKREKAQEKKAQKRQRETVKTKAAAVKAFEDLTENQDLMDCF